jgi:hypothetical protein
MVPESGVRHAPHTQHLTYFFPTAHLAHSPYRNPFLLDFEAIDAQEIQTKSAAIFFQDAKKC